MPAQIGSIITGTYRNQDVIPALLDALQDLKAEDPNEVSHYEAIFNRYALGTRDPHHLEEDDPWWDSPEADNLRSDLEEALETFAPPYCYFGSNEGSESDLGFWPDLDTAQEELQTVIDPAMLDEVDGSEALVVNDHGNVTLYARGSDLEWHEVWSIV